MKAWKIAIVVLFLVTLAMTVAGRLYDPLYNQPLAESPPKVPSALLADDDTFIWVAFSGGGTRAAAMAWKTLEELGKIPITVQRRDVAVESNLADEIDYISGISGGCFAAAAWPIYRSEPQQFREIFIERNIQTELFFELFRSPLTVFRLLSPQYSRINAAAEYYDREVFGQRTFSDLPVRPELRLHATDMALGARFTFTEQDFNQVHSDFGKYPIGFACAASSAFPVLLSPLTLKNHGTTKSLDDLKMTDRLYRQYDRNKRESVLADMSRMGREHYNDKSNAWVHLIDGGVVDNQGLEEILQEFGTTGVINRRMNDSSLPLKRLILINVNAGVRPENDLATNVEPPSVDKVVMHTMVASMDILSAKRWMRIKELVQQLYKPVIDGNSVSAIRGLEAPYTIEISFRNLRDPDLKAQCNDLPTTFTLDERQLGLIDEVVPKLIADDPDMIRLKAAVGTP